MSDMGKISFAPAGVDSEVRIPHDSTNLTPEIVRKAEEELGETDVIKTQCLKEMRRLISGERDFRPMMDDLFLLRFLRCRKYDTEAAFKTLKNFYTFKVRYARILTDIRPSELQHVYDMNIFSITPYRDKEGAIVGVGRAAQWTNTEIASVDEVFASVIAFAEHLLQNEITQICGANAIVDLKGLSLRLVRTLASPALLYRVVRAVQDCVPVRIKGLHFVNEPFFFSLLFNLLKPLLSDKIKSRVQFHGSNLKNFHKHVSPDLLPEELGGKLGPMDSRQCLKPFLERDKYFEKIFKYGYQEKRAQFIKKKSSMAFGLFL